MSGPIKETDITEAIYEIVTDEVGSSEELWPARIAEIANGLIKTGIVSKPKPVCEHWLSHEFSGDYESRCCTDGIRIDDDCELWEFCGYCGGKVEIIDCPEEFKCDE